MKKKSFLVIATLIVFAIASCGTKQKTVAESVMGVWTGIDTVQVVSVDSLGNISVQTMAVPVAVEFEYTEVPESMGVKSFSKDPKTGTEHSRKAHLKREK